MLNTRSIPTYVPSARRAAWKSVFRATYATSGGDARCARRMANHVAGPRAKATTLLRYLQGDAQVQPIRSNTPLRLAEGMLIHAPGGAVTRTKAAKAPVGRVEGYVLTWGNPRDRDLEGEYFTPHTDLCLDWYEVRPALYHHGMDKMLGVKSIGVIKAQEADDLGLWVQAQLNMRDDYARAVYGMTDKGFGWSSGSVEHLVQVGDNGEIRRWPWIEGSITPSPAQPNKTTIFPVKMSTAAYKALIDDDKRFRPYLIGHTPAGGESWTPIKSRKGQPKMASKKRIQWLRSAFRNAGLKLEDDELEAIAAETEDELRGIDDPDEFAVMTDEDYDESATMADDAWDDDAMMADEDYDDDAIMGAYMADDDLEDEDAAMSYGMRAEGMELEDEIPAQNPDNIGVSPKSRRRQAAARRAARRKSYDPFEFDDFDDYPAPPRRRSRKSASNGLARKMARLERQMDRLANARYPNEENVGRAGKSTQVQVTQAWEDKKEVYEAAFKSYLRVGPAWMEEDEKRVLKAKGDTSSWGVDSQSTFDPATKSLKVLNVSQDNSVGFAVPPDWLSELNKNINSATVMAPECRTRQTSSDRILQPDLRTTDARRAHAADVSWPGETVAAGTAHRATEFSLGQIAIPIHVMLISMTSTLSALEDVSFDLEAEISEAFVEAAAVAYDTLIYAGDGNGKMSGIVNNSDVTGTASAGVSTPGGYVAAGDTTTITSGDVIKQMFSNLPAPHRASAKWYCNSDTQLVLSQLKDSMGRYLWDQNGTGISGGLPEVLLGKPLVVNEYASGIASGAFPLVFANLRLGYTIGQRVDFSIRRFDEVRADLDQVLFIGRARLGGQVTLPAAYKVLKMAVS